MTNKIYEAIYRELDKVGADEFVMHKGEMHNCFLTFLCFAYRKDFMDIMKDMNFRHEDSDSKDYFYICHNSLRKEQKQGYMEY